MVTGVFHGLIMKLVNFAGTIHISNYFGKVLDICFNQTDSKVLNLLSITNSHGFLIKTQR